MLCRSGHYRFAKSILYQAIETSRFAKSGNAPLEKTISLLFLCHLPESHILFRDSTPERPEAIQLSDVCIGKDEGSGTVSGKGGSAETSSMVIQNEKVTAEFSPAGNRGSFILSRHELLPAYYISV